LLRIFHIAEKP